VLMRDGVAEEIRVPTGGEPADEITPLTGDEKDKAPSVTEGADEEISPPTGDETNKASSVMERADEEITDGGSAEKTSEMSCNDLEKLSFVEEV
jgi:hypothetical protein